MGRCVANSYDLSGKTAVVTGGGRGIGRAIAECLADSGATVCSWDERPGSSPRVRSEIVDVTDADQVTSALARVLGHTTRLDIVVNNAGYLGVLNAFDKHEPKDWWKIIQVNLIGMMNVAQAVVPHMRECPWGPHHQHGLASRERGACTLGCIFRSQCRRNRVYEGPWQRGTERQHFRQLRRARANRHRHDSRARSRGSRTDDQRQPDEASGNRRRGCPARCLAMLGCKPLQRRCGI